MFKKLKQLKTDIGIALIHINLLRKALFFNDEGDDIPIKCHPWWDISGVLSSIIYEYLNEFHKYDAVGFPLNSDECKWNTEILKMMYSFDLIRRDAIDGNNLAAYKEGMDLFKDRFRHLWT